MQTKRSLRDELDYGANRWLRFLIVFAIMAFGILVLASYLNEPDTGSVVDRLIRAVENLPHAIRKG